VQELVLDAGALLGLEVAGKVEEIADLLGAEILEGEERASPEIHGHGIFHGDIAWARCGKI
jgi:hypothetical protein